MLKRLGAATISIGEELLYALGFFFRSLTTTLHYIRKGALGKRVIVMQLLFTGVEALGVTALLAVSLGAVIIIQGVSILPQFGQGQLIYTILITVITRELGPVLCAFIVIARSATAIATELGHMVVSHQIEAYTATGVDPIRYLVAPRYIGVTLSMVLLNIYFNLFGLVGSYVLTQFFESIHYPMHDGPRDLLAGLPGVRQPATYQLSGLHRLLEQHADMPRPRQSPPRRPRAMGSPYSNRHDGGPRPQCHCPQPGPVRARQAVRRPPPFRKNAARPTSPQRPHHLPIRGGAGAFRSHGHGIVEAHQTTQDRVSEVILHGQVDDTPTRSQAQKDRIIEGLVVGREEDGARSRDMFLSLPVEAMYEGEIGIADDSAQPVGERIIGPGAGLTCCHGSSASLI